MSFTAAYWKTDDELRAIAEELNMTSFELVNAFCSLPSEKRDRVRPLLRTQLRNIEALRRKRLFSYGNVLVLPVAGLR